MTKHTRFLIADSKTRYAGSQLTSDDAFWNGNDLAGVPSIHYQQNLQRSYRLPNSQRLLSSFTRLLGPPQLLGTILEQAARDSGTFFAIRNCVLMIFHLLRRNVIRWIVRRRTTRSSSPGLAPQLCLMLDCRDHSPAFFLHMDPSMDPCPMFARCIFFGHGVLYPMAPTSRSSNASYHSLLHPLRPD